MKSRDYVEIEDAKFINQLGLFWKGLLQHGATLGFTPAEIDDAEKDYLWMKYVTEQQNKVQTYGQAHTSFKKLARMGKQTILIEPKMVAPPAVPTPVPAGIEKRFRRRVKKVKSHINYAKSMG